MLPLPIPTYQSAVTLVESEIERNVAMKWRSRSCVTWNVILNSAKRASLVLDDNQTHMRVRNWWKNINNR